MSHVILLFICMCTYLCVCVCIYIYCIYFIMHSKFTEKVIDDFFLINQVIRKALPSVDNYVRFKPANIGAVKISSTQDSAFYIKCS